MRKTFVIGFILMVTLCVVSQSAGFFGFGSSSFSTPDDKVSLKNSNNINSNHLEEEQSMSLDNALEQYHEALKTGDNEQLFRSYRALCIISLKRLEYDKVFEYGQKAIDLYKYIPQNYNISSIYMNMYQASPEKFPCDDEHGKLIDKMVETANTDLSLFNALSYKAIFYALRNDKEKYYEYRNGYKALENGNPDFSYRNNSIYYRAESYHYYFTGQKDSVFALRRKIRSRQERSLAMMTMYRNYGMYKEAMLYADSADRAMRQDNANVNNLTTAELQNTIDKTNLSIEEQKERENIALQESRQRQQMLEIQRQQLENEQAAAKAQRLKLEAEKKKRDIAVEESKIRQREAEANRLAMERKENMEIQEEMDKAASTNITYIIISGMLITVIVLAFWVRKGIKVFTRMRQLTAAQQKAHQAAVAAAENKDNFISNMSHDMKDPLQKVAHYAKILADDNSGLSDDERMDIGIKAQEVGIKLLDYINKILDPASVSSHPDHSTDEERISQIKGMRALTIIAVIVFTLFMSLFSQNGYGVSFDEDFNYNNPYKVDNEVYDAYLKVYTLRSDLSKMLPEWKKAIAMAEQRGERKGQCMLYWTLMDAYQLKRDDANLASTAEKLRELSKRYGYTQYYYNAFTVEAYYYAQQNDIVKAMHIAGLLRHEAEQTGDPFGLFYTYCAYANISDARDDPRGVVEWTTKAIDIADNLSTQQDLSSLYIDIYKHTPQTTTSDKGKTLLKKALSEAKTPIHKAYVYMEMVQSSYYRNDTAAFYDNLKKLREQNVNHFLSRSPEIMAINAMEKAMEGKTDSAFAILGQSKSLNMLKIRLQIAKKENRYKEALEVRDEILKANDMQRRMRYSNDLKSLTEYQSSDSLYRAHAQRNIQMQQLAVKDKELQLSRQRLALEKEKKNDELKRLEMANMASEDSLQMRTAELARRQAETKAEAARLRVQKSEMEQQKLDNVYEMGKIGVVVVLSIIVILLLLRLWSNYSTKRLQKQHVKLHHAYQEAVNAKEMRESFIQNMSHEIRTPLNAILGFAQLLSLPADSFEKDERKTFAEHVDNNVKLLSMLIEDIVNIGDIEKGKYSITIAPTRLNDVIHAAISTVEYRATSDIQLLMETELPDDYQIMTDGQRIMQVLINYLTNGIKHTVSGTVKAKVAKEDGLIRFSVSDTGTGVPPEQAENIFRRFVKLEEFVQGTGLGLNICLVIAENLHGRCYLDKNYPASEPGLDHGARFIFEIPAEEVKS